MRIRVETNKRSYTVIGPENVTWEKGEKVVSIEPVPESENYCEFGCLPMDHGE